MDELQKFKTHLDMLANGNGCGEATYQFLESLLKRNPRFIEILEKRFEMTTDPSDKEDYAMLIVSVSPTEPYKSYLMDHHDWEESDFE